MGPPVVQLEAAVASLCRAPHAIACASGTDALLLALKALRLEPGDEVITTPFTFFATAGAIHNAGGTPVFVDVEPDTFNIDPAAVAAVAEHLRKLRLHGGAKQYHHDEVGTNSRLDTVQAAVLLAKLPHLVSWSGRRREIAAYYTERLADLPTLQPPVVDPCNEPI